MRFVSPRFVRAHVRLFLATLVAVASAASTTIAQFGTFDPSFDGELWGVRHELTDGTPAGVAYFNRTLFVTDATDMTVRAYDSSGHVVPTTHDDWNAADTASPVSGLAPHQLLATVIEVDGTNRDALLISDDKSNRVAAFDITGTHLFTLRLERPSAAALYSLSIGELALSPGARFSLNTSTQTLTLTGAFAAAWVEQITTGAVDSGAMIFQGPVSFALAGSEFNATPAVIKRGNEHDAAAPAPRHFFGVAFDTAGNLYALDAFNERLHVYDSSLNHLFTFGTPVADGTTAEFHEPWGLAFWPDPSGTGGRIFINDTYKSRILVYRPFDTDGGGSAIDGLQLETIIKGFVAAKPAISLFGIALDPASGSIAVTDFADDDNAHPRAVVLQQANLAPFDLRVLDDNGAVVQGVCTSANYTVRFSLTVPAGRPTVTNVAPQLTINGLPAASTPVPAAPYPAPLSLAAGQVVTYTYALTAPVEADQDLAIVASATTNTSADVLQRGEMIAVERCQGETDQSVITAVPSRPPQVSGWTPVFEGEEFSVTLRAQDDDGIGSIEYQLEGANESGWEPIATAFDGLQKDAVVAVPIPDLGRTTLTYRVRDGNAIWSNWRTLQVRTRLVPNRSTNENVSVEFRVGDPEGTGFSYSVTGLPAGVSFSTATGQFGGLISLEANDRYSADPAVAAGVYHVVVTETSTSGASSNVGFTWTINNINRNPIIHTQASANLSIIRGRPLTMQIEGSDPDRDPSIFTVSGRGVNNFQDLPQSITIDPSTGLISGIFPADADSKYEITVGLAECSRRMAQPPCNLDPLPGERLATLFAFTLAVVDDNEPADVVNPGAQISAEGDSPTLAIQASDPDGDALNFEAVGLPPGLSIDGVTGVISGSLGMYAAGSYAVTVDVQDHVNSETRAVTFNWIVTDKNLPPVVTVFAWTNSEGEAVNRFVVATDPENKPLTFVATGLPPGVTINDAGVVSGSFDFAAAGVYQIALTVSDGAVVTSASFNWTVLNVNRWPELVAPSRLNAEGDAVSLLLSATDADGDALTYSATGLPRDLSLDPSTGRIAGALRYDSAGVYTVNVGVSDGMNAIVRTFPWTVTDVNRAPIVNAIADRTNNEGDSIVLPAIAVTDPDGDTAFTFSATNLPAGITMNPLTGALGGSLSYSAAGVYQVGVSVRDASGGQATVSFKWTVMNVNRAPVVINPGNQTSAEGATIAKSINASEPDGQTLSYTVTGLPPSLSVNALGVIVGTLPYTASGTYTVTVSASDGSLATSQTFTWIVTNVNRAPVAVEDASSVTQGQPIVVNVRGNDSDPDGDTLTVKSVTTPTSGTVAIGAGGTTVTYTAAATFVGTATFNYTVSDSAATATAKVTVTVLTSNKPPTCSAATGGEIWPPNHKKFYIASVNGVTDPEKNPITIKVTGIWQDELLDSTGDGNFSPDGQIENGQAWVRGERNGNGNKAAGDGRVYEILFTATDSKGASCNGSVLWTVPHDQGRGSSAVDTGRRYDSTGVIPGSRDKSQIHLSSPRP